MDVFNSGEFYGCSLSDDPKLRTTTRNYEFKYNSSDHLERTINRVRTDREKKKQMLDELVCKQRQFPKTQISPISKIPMVETQIGSSSREAVVKIMTDEEIEAMISQAMHSKDNSFSERKTEASQNVAIFNDHKSDEIPETDEVQKEPKLNQLLVMETIPMAQPQWVEIKPAQKSTASIFDVLTDNYYVEDSSDSEDLNLTDETLKDDQMKETITNQSPYFDSLSFDSKMSEDLVIRNQGSNHRIDDELPNSPISLGIELPLNESEHLEMERVFGQVLPNIPPMELENLDTQDESQCSEYSDEEEDNATIEDDKIEDHIQPVVHIQQIDYVQQQIQPLSQRSVQSSLPKTSRSVKKNPRSTKPATPVSSNINSPKTPMKKNLNLQIEDLKQEKIKIFSKMTSIQEKIIKSLDELRINLVEISLPDDEIEKKIRERNVLEFSVRFSRNYLFPLGKMVEDLQASPKENYHSALTNESCVKVCGIYGLLNQALQCFQKQLRHFFTNSIPKKLDTLLNLIKDTTNICLDKQIFDKRDTLIQSLVFRCEMFLEFLMEFSQKEKNVRAEANALRSERKSQFKLPKTSSKWDLTMNLNKLNMYEPKLVPKKPKKNPQKKPATTSVRSTVTSNHLKPKKQKLIPRKSDSHVTLPVDDPVDTQVRRDNNVRSVQLINDVIAEQPDSDLAKTVIETLQDITKDEVHQMFGPIISNLDSILKSTDNPQTTVDSVLNILKSKLQELKIDEISTENITQNNNTYQKEMTEKGTHLSKSEQQQQKFEENRQNKVSRAKTKATSRYSKNVKEGSTKQTERYNSRSELTDSIICDKQSLSNIDDVAAFVSEKENASMKQKTRNGAFMPTKAAVAKKPTLARDSIEIGGKATLLTISPTKLNEVMPQPHQHEAVTSQQCLEYLTKQTVGQPQADKCQQGIGDRKYQNEDVPPQQKERDGAANAIDETKNSQEAWRKNLTMDASSVKNEETKSGQIEDLKYCKNALYTFVKYSEDILPSPNIPTALSSFDNILHNDPSEEEEKQQKEISGKPSKDDSFKSALESNTDLASPPEIKTQKQEIHHNKADIQELLEERQAFIARCKDDPFYNNPQFPEPWKVLSKISERIAREIYENFENNLSFGEESYVQDFIDMEMQT